jgi:2-polyprenyl-6-methoxyphenol hydroxylase-like FAD-dependent oxidoreductase
MTGSVVRRLTTRCCIVGGGPAGMMLGYLLGRAGIETLVLEKHADFFRDFRGDTVHPSTLAVMAELGLIDDFLKLPHQRLQKLVGQFGETRVQVADLSRLDVPWPFIAFMPQWDFLDFLRDRAAAFPSFRLMMQAEATGRLGPALGPGLAEVASWDDVKLLQVVIDRLRRWALPGLLWTGDAAHAMSPVGGVGVNLAVQDAVATANLLAGPLAAGTPTLAELEAVQRRRAFPARMTQRAQVAVQNLVVLRALDPDAPVRPPLPLRAIDAVPRVQGLTARLIGMGVRPEHVRSPVAPQSGASM